MMHRNKPKTVLDDSSLVIQFNADKNPRPSAVLSLGNEFRGGNC